MKKTLPVVLTAPVVLIAIVALVILGVPAQGSRPARAGGHGGPVDFHWLVEGGFHGWRWISRRMGWFPRRWEDFTAGGGFPTVAADFPRRGAASRGRKRGFRRRQRVFRGSAFRRRNGDFSRWSVWAAGLFRGKRVSAGGPGLAATNSGWGWGGLGAGGWGLGWGLGPVLGLVLDTPYPYGYGYDPWWSTPYYYAPSL